MKGFLILMMICSSVVFGEATYLFTKMEGVDMFAKSGLIINLLGFWILGIIKAQSLLKDS